jgi:hypothetical protein
MIGGGKPARRNPSARRFVYTITGPGGAYVGVTRDVAHRWTTHRASVRHAAASCLVHDVMREHGLDAYRFEVVACARDLEDGRHLEFEVMKQLHADGHRLLNTRRRAPGASRRAEVESIPAVLHGQ